MFSRVPELENKSLLSEDLRQQYLKCMGIQSWFDLSLDVAELSAKNVLDDDGLVGDESQASDLSKNIPENIAAAKANVLRSEVTEEPAIHETLDLLSTKIAKCELCELHINRQQAISGEGSAEAKIFIIIDAPVLDVAGEHALLSTTNKQMIQAMLQAIGSTLASVFITSLVKCRPPENRAPQTSEMICCDDHLSAQINLVKPGVILVLGERASQQLLVSQKSLTDLRLRHHRHQGIPVYASYHPGELFGSSEAKRKVWADLLQIKQHIK